MRFKTHHRTGSAGPRTGTVHTPHGSFPTPAFMTVGTQGTVKGLSPAQVRQTGAGILLGNTYHLLLKPGPELLERAGGLHRFMRWDGPILTDSGGFQVFSLGHLNRIDDDGVVFKNPHNGDLVPLTPERSIATQHAIGSDILMAFDDCPPAGGGEEARARSRVAMDRTHRWLDRCVAFHRESGRSDRQALFGIVQGGTDEADRAACVDAVCSHDLPGYAIGGVAVGEDTAAIDHVVAFTAPRMPADKPRYLMGVGYPRDIVAAVRAGVDLFDCVLPTRLGRSGHAFLAGSPSGGDGILKLKNAASREDFRVLEEGCPCPACAGGFTRAYLHHLVKARELLAGSLLTMHNLTLYQRLMADLRATIPGGDWTRFFERWPSVTADA